MPTPAERRALLFLAALAALGVTARGIAAVRGSRGGPGGDTEGLDRQIAAVDSAVAGSRNRSQRKERAAAPPAPRIKRRTPGDDGGTPPGVAQEPPADPLSLYETRRRAVEASNREARERVAAEAERLAPGRARLPIPSGSAPSTVPEAARPLVVDLDIAGADAIAGLPWIGEALAARIVAERLARGPFGSLQGLQRVRGIGPALAARIAPFVTFSRPASQLQANPSHRRRPGGGYRP